VKRLLVLGALVLVVGSAIPRSAEKVAAPVKGWADETISISEGDLLNIALNAYMRRPKIDGQAVGKNTVNFLPGDKPSDAIVFVEQQYGANAVARDMDMVADQDYLDLAFALIGKWRGGKWLGDGSFIPRLIIRHVAASDPGTTLMVSIAAKQSNSDLDIMRAKSIVERGGGYWYTKN
jgi:hypothetical protein